MSAKSASTQEAASQSSSGPAALGRRRLEFVLAAGAFGLWWVALACMALLPR